MKKIVFVFLIGLLSGLIVRTTLAAGYDDAPNTIFDQTETQDKIKQEQQKECPNVAPGCSCIRPVKKYKVLNGVDCEDTSQVCSEGAGDKEKHTTVFYSCCICDVKGEGGNVSQLSAGESGFTFTTCQEQCKKTVEGSTIDKNIGAGTFPPPKLGKPPTLRDRQFENALCFTAKQCESDQYGGKGAFRPGLGCPTGKGKCVAPEPDIQLSGPIEGKTSVTGLRQYIAVVYKFLINAGLIVTAIMFVYGGFLYIVGSAFEDIGKAKNIMLDAAIGLILTLCAMTLLKTINPATLRLDTLVVYMINKQEIMGNQFCAHIESGNVGALNFASAGDPPEYTPLAQATYNIKAEDTRCNYEYYAQGFQDYRCVGKKCDAQGEVCVSCASGACARGSDQKAYGCVQATWAGEISYDGKNNVTKILPMVICKDALAAVPKNPGKALVDMGDVTDAVFKVSTKENVLYGGGDERGVQTYRIVVTEAGYAQAEKDCEGHGGIVGFVLGVQFRDPKSSLKIPVVNINLLPTYDDVAIATKTHRGPADFAGYADGQTAFDYNDMERAVYCGMLHGDKVLANPANMWTPDDVKKAIGIGGQQLEPIKESALTLTPSNAPSDPSRGPKAKLDGCGTETF